MEAIKEKRASNFTQDETELLVSLVKKYKSIIECKKSDVVLWKEKCVVWRKIQDEFNVESGAAYRNADCLKKKYENIKKSTKKKYAEQKYATLATGGGPQVPVVMGNIDEELLDMLNTQVTGLPSEFDSDAHYNIQSNVSTKSYEIDGENNESLDEEILGSKDFNDCNTSACLDIMQPRSKGDAKNNKENEGVKEYNSTKLRTPKSTPLQIRKRKENITNKMVHDEFYNLATTKTDVLKVTRSIQEQRWEIERKHMEELHDMKMKKLKIELEESKIRKECAQKELDILNLKSKSST